MKLGRAATAILNDQPQWDGHGPWQWDGQFVIYATADPDDPKVTFGNVNGPLGWSTEDGRSSDSQWHSHVLTTHVWRSQELVDVCAYLDSVVRNLTVDTYSLPANVLIRRNGHGIVTSVTVQPSQGWDLSDEWNEPLADYLTAIRGQQADSDEYPLSWEG